MSLRIIGGKFRNRLLKSPKGEQTRPTTAIIRKAVFDICQFEIQDANFLDVFAGSGLMGIEALSRGADKATFIDIDRYAIRCIHENINILQLDRQANIISGDALTALERLNKGRAQFQLIYVDPPYRQKTLNEQILHFLDSSCLVASGGIVFIEETLPIQLKSNTSLKTLVHRDTRKFGKSVLHQYRKVS